MLRYEEEEQLAGKGVLFGNAWREVPSTDRDTAETPTFPANVIERGSQLGIALVSSVGFYHAFCQFVEGRKDGASILRKLAATSGVVDFS